jgi:hypothetical protein
VTRVDDIAQIVRSKNAGIGYVTVDLLFPDRAAYERARTVITPERAAAAYGLTAADLTACVYFDAGLAIKVTLPRQQLAGGAGLGETDLYGSGQYAPLAEIELADPEESGN